MKPELVQTANITDSNLLEAEFESFVRKDCGFTLTTIPCEPTVQHSPLGTRKAFFFFKYFYLYYNDIE